MSRQSVHSAGFQHSNPIPAASRIGDLIATGVINGTDPQTGELGADLETQCEYMFAHVRNIVEAAGGSTDDILKMTVWMQDRSQRDVLNAQWLNMFPDPRSRPARHAIQNPVASKFLIQCDVLAVISRND
ncbi:Endoribonuclease L-PSP [Alloalcanivorax dieselolei B5]|uniref:Endoribonuclease L-PSP n=1 Tax=Alcanivorax dieselolei (strain DSM 16502 / CGMCC 1.3690 / MCCC 1A00001 / B-5) TaxID=930169 RepID=K0C805_ALCDB|nr:RidA family protein [Alloalcanivorax dieselolei]AFT69639.1 Endoribonuclease L-PSP [Alloalcanivorax dieselolei B5]GGK03518.1 enamine deaminase RidA [Alloalcanivorax dieselolei]